MLDILRGILAIIIAVSLVSVIYNSYILYHIIKARRK